MSDTLAQFSVLKQTADPAVAEAIQRLIEQGEDHELNRINLLDFSARTGLDEERANWSFILIRSQFSRRPLLPMRIRANLPFNFLPWNSTSTLPVSKASERVRSFRFS